MARIIYTALVESIRGSIKGTTFQRNAYGHTIKAKPNMVNPRSPKQGLMKTTFGSAVAAWRELSNTNRAAWNAYANTYPIPTRLNPSAYLNGFNAFGRWHAVARTAVQGSLLPNPSGTQGVLGTYTNRIISSAGSLYFDSDCAPSNGTWTMLIFLTRRLTPTQRFVKSWSRFITYDTADGTIHKDITSVYAATFGAGFNTGDLIGTRTVLIKSDTGQLFFPQPEIIAITV